MINGLIGNAETLRSGEFTFPPPTFTPIAVLAKPKKNGLQCTLRVLVRHASTFVVQQQHRGTGEKPRSCRMIHVIQL